MPRLRCAVARPRARATVQRGRVAAGHAVIAATALCGAVTPGMLTPRPRRRLPDAPPRLPARRPRGLRGASARVYAHARHARHQRHG